MTNLEWIQQQATTEQIATMLDRIACETCAYEKNCNLAAIHYGQLDCHSGIIEWLKQEREDV